MDGRWAWAFSAGLVWSMVGCQTPQQRQDADLVKQTAATTKMVKSQQALAAQDPPPAKDHKLKSETLVKLGALKDQAAENTEKSQTERDAFRYQARQSYQKAIDQDPKCIQAYLALAGSYWASGEQDKATAVFDKAIKANPKNGQLYYELGTIQLRAKDWSQGLDSLSTACQLDPENKHYQKTYGLALARNGRFDDGYAVLAKCMSESEARFNVARMLKHVGQTDACNRQLELALKANPDYMPAREMLDEPSVQSTVKTAKYEESQKPPVAHKPTEPMNMPSVPSGSNDMAPRAPVQEGFDGPRN
jgi:tetratricopeptide (TPR) repeat protein